MIIKFHRDNLVDFEDIIHMTDAQREKFIESMQTIFPGGVDVMNVSEKDRLVGNKETAQKKWMPEEYPILLGPETNEQLESRLGRSVMSIRMKRGDFVPDFFVWAKKKGVSLPIDAKTIKKFLDEKGLL